MNLVMIPFHDWKKCEREGFRTRDAHWMQEFGKHPLVDKLLIINRPISLAERVLLRRNLCAKQSQVVAQRGLASVSQVGEKTFTLDVFVPEVILPVLMRRKWTTYIFGREMVARAVTFALKALNIVDYALFTSAPLFVPLVRQLSPRVFVLDALDNLLKHALYKDIPGLEGYYEFCQDRADLLFANSLETTRWLGQRRPDTVHIPNGVDTDMFDSARSYVVPDDMTMLAHPVVGYAGKMQDMFDVALMERVMSELPNVNFVFIGQQLNMKWIKPLWRYPNAHYLGDKPYSLLARYLSAFDICIIPYLIQRQHGGDPIKFYEYLAMGKPVVTTNIGGVRAFDQYPHVCVADTGDEFFLGLQRFVQDVQQGVRVEAPPLPAECLWKTKADRMLCAITDRLEAE